MMASVDNELFRRLKRHAIQPQAKNKKRELKALETDTSSSEEEREFNLPQPMKSR